jgi:hypothetical protein
MTGHPRITGPELPSNFMIQITNLLLALLLQTNVAGLWGVTLSVPSGDKNYRMFIVQKGTRLSGYLLNEVGQFDMEGTIDGNQIGFAWTIPSGGRLLRITFTGKVEKDFMSGVAKVGNLGDAALTAER